MKRPMRDSNSPANCGLTSLTVSPGYAPFAPDRHERARAYVRSEIARSSQGDQADPQARRRSVGGGYESLQIRGHKPQLVATSFDPPCSEPQRTTQRTGT